MLRRTIIVVLALRAWCKHTWLQYPFLYAIGDKKPAVGMKQRRASWRIIRFFEPWTGGYDIGYETYRSAPAA
jgi:hypothetical protein